MLFLLGIPITVPNLIRNSAFHYALFLRQLRTFAITIPDTCTIVHMAVLLSKDIPQSKRCWQEWKSLALSDPTQLDQLPRMTWAMAVRYTLWLLERKVPGPGVEVRVAPWGAVKILEGPASDPHNLTPPDVIELEPRVWLELAAGITDWHTERENGNITAVGERDDLSDILPLEDE